MDWKVGIEASFGIPKRTDVRNRGIMRAMNDRTLLQCSTEGLIMIEILQLCVPGIHNCRIRRSAYLKA